MVTEYFCNVCRLNHPVEFVCDKPKYLDDREHRELIHRLLQTYIRNGTHMDGSFYPSGADAFIDAYLKEMKGVGHC